MRLHATAGGTLLKAYAGTTGVLLAFDVEPARRAGLLGFAIERSGGNRPKQFLTGQMHFPDADHEPGTPIPSDVAPVQKFRWSDYRVFPDTDYTYTLRPVTGSPRQPVVEDGPTVVVRTPSATSGTHRVLFNRAAAASQAFSRQFPEVADELDAARAEGREPVLPDAVLTWLSRGVLEQIVGFCARATDPSWALDVAIYEYELPEIVKAVNAARDRGADVRIVYHAKRGDEQTEINEANVEGWPAGNVRARTTSRIFHDKFIVLSRVHQEERSPVSVLCGSTNFTHNGVYRQANVIHVAEDAAIATRYLSLFDTVFGGADVGDTRKWVNENNPLEPTARTYAGFSPRSGGTDLDLMAADITAATQDAIFCTAFNIDDRLEQALLGTANDDILRLGLQNTRSRITGVHRDRTADFVATAMLKDGLDGWLRESTAGQRGNILIHTKLVVVDFTTDNPTVISGSHNLSKAASANNDENYLILRGDTDVADCYGIEALRLYDHYRARWHLAQRGRRSTSASRRLTLTPDDSWTTRYFEDGDLACLDRLRFAGPWPEPQ